MEKSCETCEYDLGETVWGVRYCGNVYSGGTDDCWRPKESDIRTEQESIDRAFTAFTDKLKGERTMEKSCKTCGFLCGILCGLDGADTRVVHCEKYKAWKPKDVNQDVVQNDLLKFSDICLSACSDKSCSTCRHQDMFSDPCSSLCVNYSLWEPEESDIHTAQEAIDRTSTALTDTQKKISEICDEVKNILLEKNRKYGDSALNPKRVFSKASPIEQINVRIDDKISRIMSAQDDDTEDAELDLIGYLILKRVAERVADDVQ